MESLVLGHWVSYQLFMPVLPLALIAILYYFALFTYRLKTHPLAHLPGPLIARVSDWYNVWKAWSGDRHIDFYRLHQKYGPVVRYGPSRVSIDTNTALHAIYNRKANVQKSSYYSIFSHYFKAPSVLTTITAKEHGRKRRIIGQGLSDGAIAAMEGHILKHVRNFCDKLLQPEMFEGGISIQHASKKSKGPWSQAKDMSRWASYLTFDIMGDVCFSNTFNMLDSSENHYMLDVLPAGVRGLNIIGHMQGLASLHLDKIIFRDLAIANDRYKAFSDKQASERIANADKVTVKDVFYFLQKGRDPETGEAFTLPELVSESSLLIVGGTDTTATAISSTLFYLLHNPTALDKLTAEVFIAFPTSDSLESIRGGLTFQSCTYLRACIDESLRMSPGVGGILPREVLPGGIDIDGHHFPPGVDVGVPIYAIQHHDAYYPQPWEFIPERWVVNTDFERQLEPSEAGDDSIRQIGSPESVALAKSAFCPFGLGLRGCVGKSMAYKEISIVIARLVWLYEMRLSPGRSEGEGNPEAGVQSGRHRVGEYQCRDMFVLKAKGPIVEFRLRKRGGG